MPCTRRNDICLPATHKHRGEHTRTYAVSIIHVALLDWVLISGASEREHGGKFARQTEKSPSALPPPGLVRGMYATVHELPFSTSAQTSFQSFTPPSLYRRPLFDYPLPSSYQVRQ